MDIYKPLISYIPWTKSELPAIVKGFLRVIEDPHWFDEEFNMFPSNPMYGQSYVPIQVMGRTFKPEVGLKHGTIFPELVSPYCPNQSIEEIEFIRMNNKIGEGCNG